MPKQILLSIFLVFIYFSELSACKIWAIISKHDHSLNIQNQDELFLINNHISFLNVNSKVEIPSARANPCSYTKSVKELTSILKLGFFKAGYIPVGIGIVFPAAIFTGFTIQALR